MPEPEPGPEFENLLTPAEVAAMWRVDVKTVAKWVKAGKITAIRTPGNHRRFFAAEVNALLSGKPLTAAEVRALKERVGGGR